MISRSAWDPRRRRRPITEQAAQEVHICVPPPHVPPPHVPYRVQCMTLFEFTSCSGGDGVLRDGWWARLRLRCSQARARGGAEFSSRGDWHPMCVRRGAAATPRRLGMLPERGEACKKRRCHQERSCEKAATREAALPPEPPASISLSARTRGRGRPLQAPCRMEHVTTK